MQRLLCYTTVIYDANCIVYYSFSVTERDTTGLPVPVLSPNTDRARRITNALVYNKKTITTVRKAFEEADKILVGKALTDLVANGTIQKQLKIKGTLDPMLKLRITKNLRSELERLKRQGWFTINAYVPDTKRSEQVKQLYSGFCRDPAFWKRIPPGKGEPSDVDISLLLFSADFKHPLLTNDGELYNFDAELRANGFCEAVHSFLAVKLQ